MAQATKIFDLSHRGAAPLRSAPAEAAAPVVIPEPPQQEGPRRLVRPRLPAHLAAPPAAPRRLRGSAPLAGHATYPVQQSAAHPAAGHAESFYLQKQMQTQTEMVFVLEDGEQIHGVVEWFDRDTIKVRNATRVLLFKHSIKYLYKAGGESQG